MNAAFDDAEAKTTAKNGLSESPSEAPPGKALDTDMERQHSPQTEKTPYTIFTKPQKHFISLAASFAGMFSTLCSYVYYPALVPIASDLKVTVALVNLTITSYLAISAVAPAFMGDMADQSGRRPIYGLMFLLFIGANVGIAVNQTYGGLVVLRMLQSAGSSGLIAVAYGVIADITTPKDRGGFMGVFDLLLNFALALGPVIGGSITNTLGWRWVFWFLTILTSSHFLLMIVAFPETQRKIAGNGSVKPKGVYWSLVAAMNQRKLVEKKEKTETARYWPNPLTCLKILGDMESLMVIALYAIPYATKMAAQASLGAQCVQIYDLDYLTAGLVYLPSGVAGIIGAFTTGRLLNKVYAHEAKKFFKEEEHGHDYPPEFPIEKARLKGIYMMVSFTALSILGYGIALMTKAHIAVMIVMQFTMGLAAAGIFTESATLLTDLNKGRSATAQGACSVVRCLLAAACVAILEPLTNAAGLGWCFGFYAILLAFCVPTAWLLQKKGVQWRVTKARSTTAT